MHEPWLAILLHRPVMGSPGHTRLYIDIDTANAQKSTHIANSAS